MDISIIQPNASHVEDISRICSIGWLQTVKGKYSKKYERENVQYWYNHKKVLEDIANGIYTHVALIGNEVAGTIGGIVTEEISEIYVFYVDEKFRYQGIGKKLLEAFTVEHLKQGAVKQAASVEKGNALGIPFYEARGFRLGKDKRYWRNLHVFVTE